MGKECKMNNEQHQWGTDKYGYLNGEKYSVHDPEGKDRTNAYTLEKNIQLRYVELNKGWFTYSLTTHEAQEMFLEGTDEYNEIEKKNQQQLIENRKIAVKDIFLRTKGFMNNIFIDEVVIEYNQENGEPLKANCKFCQHNIFYVDYDVERKGYYSRDNARLILEGDDGYAELFEDYKKLRSEDINKRFNQGMLLHSKGFSRPKEESPEQLGWDAQDEMLKTKQYWLDRNKQLFSVE